MRNFPQRSARARVISEIFHREDRQNAWATASTGHKDKDVSCAGGAPARRSDVWSSGVAELASVCASQLAKFFAHLLRRTVPGFLNRDVAPNVRLSGYPFRNKYAQSMRQYELLQTFPKAEPGKIVCGRNQSHQHHRGTIVHRNEPNANAGGALLAMQ